MNSTVSSFFSRDSFLRRQTRTRTRKNAPSSSLKGKPLHIIPELSEEDEPRLSDVSVSRSPSPAMPMTYYSPSLSAGGSQTLGVKAKRRHASVKLSDIRVARDVFVQQDELSTDNSLLFAPRPAPRPPTSPLSSPSQSSDNDTTSSSPDSFRLTFTEMGNGVSFNFPHPPLPTPSSLQRQGFESPTPSLASSSTSSSCPGSPTGGLPTTPFTSDDESPEPESSHRSSRRASIKPLIIAKHTPPSDDDMYELDLSAYTSPELLQPFKNQQELQSEPEPEPEQESDSEDASDWYAREFSEILTLYSPLPPSFPLPASRPESMSASHTSLNNLPPSPSPQPRRSRISKPLPEIPTPSFPSAQLDPTFPRRKRSIPKRAPPPPPVPPIPAHLRPPPRMSVPADFGFFDEDLEEDASESSGSIYSQDPECDVHFDVDVRFELDLDVPMRLPLSLPGSPIDLEADIATGLEELRLRGEEVDAHREPAIPETPIDDVFLGDERRMPGERVLRSRWSSSTLSSTIEERASAPSKLRSYFGGATKKGRGRKSVTTPTSPMPASPTPFSPSKRYRHEHGHARGMSRDSDVMIIGYGAGVKRRGSTSGSSVAGSDTGSCESAGSAGSGLRRKPIPVEMFLRTAA